MFFAENILYATVEEKKNLSWSDIVVCQYDSLPKLGYWKVQKSDNGHHKGLCWEHGEDKWDKKRCWLSWAADKVRIGAII